MKRGSKLLTWFAPVFWLGIWELTAVLLQKPLLLPSPIRVILCLAQMVQTAAFWKTIAFSLARVGAGIIGAVFLGIIFGFLTARSRLANILFRPVFTAMKSTPVASVTILLLIWVSRSIVPILISAVMVFPTIWSAVFTGVGELDRDYKEMARAFQITGLRYIEKLLIPGIRPYLEAAFRSAIGFAWKAGIAAEVLTVPGISIGKMIYDSKLYLQTTELFAWTTAVVLLSLVLEKLVLHGIGRRDSQ